jgi:hypothetical protein
MITPLPAPGNEARPTTPRSHWQDRDELPIMGSQIQQLQVGHRLPIAQKSRDRRPRPDPEPTSGHSRFGATTGRGFVKVEYRNHT